MLQNSFRKIGIHWPIKSTSKILEALYVVFKSFLLAILFIYVVGGIWLIPIAFLLPNHFASFEAVTLSGRLIERMSFLFSFLAATGYVNFWNKDFKSLLPFTDLSWKIKVDYFLKIASITFFCVALSYLISYLLGFITINNIKNSFIITNPLSGLWNLFLLGVVGHFLVALGEETVYRGVVFRYLLVKTDSKTFALIVSALIFSLFHFHYEMPFSFLIAFLMGGFLALIYLHYGSLLCCISIHWAYNLFMHIFMPSSKNYLPDYIDVSLQEVPGWGSYFTLIRTIILALILLIFVRNKNQIQIR